MKKNNKKGFTIVELVIVIAVIAILAAVLIPTFSGIVKKANIANDTAVAKNLNTAAISAQADTFDEALTAAQESGYLVANLNAKSDKCYFVWEDDTDQFLLYNLKDRKIIYSNTTVTGDPDASWCFAINNPADEAAVKAVWNAVTFKTLVADINDLSSVLAAGGNIYFDESLVLNSNHLLKIDSTATINLGNSSLNTSGIVETVTQTEAPIQIEATGNVTLNGGHIASASEAFNLDNRLVKFALLARVGSNLTINDTVFDNAAYNAQMKFESTAVLNNVVIKATKSGLDTRYDAQVTLNNVTINMFDSSFNDGYGTWVWSCNSAHDDTKNAKVIINSGTYTRESITHGVNYGGLHSCGGSIEVNGGTFTANDNKYFSLTHSCGEIVIKGGTFGGKTFGSTDFTKSYIESLCVGSCTVTQNADGSFTITK